MLTELENIETNKVSRKSTKQDCLVSIIKKFISDKNVKLVPLTEREIYCLALIDTLYKQGFTTVDIYRMLINHDKNKD